MRLLLVGAPLQQRVAEHLDAEHVVRAAGRHAGLGELLAEDHLLERRQPGAAVLDRPARGEVAALVQRRAPLGDELGQLVAVELPDAAPVGRQLLGEERLDLLAVGLGLGGVGRLHGRDVTAAVTAGSRARRRAERRRPPTGSSGAAPPSGGVALERGERRRADERPDAVGADAAHLRSAGASRRWSSSSASGVEERLRRTRRHDAADHDVGDVEHRARSRRSARPTMHARCAR